MVSLEVESWIWYGIAASFVLARSIARITHLGSLSRLQVDDYLMVLTLCFYTVEIVAMNMVATTQSNLLPPNYLDHHTLSSHEIAARAHGSRWVMVVEQCQCVLIWLVKGCLLAMYYRLTKHAYPTSHLLVKFLLAYVVITFIVMEVLYFGVWCRPFSNYFAVPTPNMQCSAATHHLTVNTVFNLSSDVLMLAIPLPVFAHSRLPLARKFVLCTLFGLGVFVILCAVLSKYYSFANPFGSEWMNWYIREASMAVIIANLPFAWGLGRRLVARVQSKSGHASGQASSTLDRSTAVSRRRANTQELPVDELQTPSTAYLERDDSRAMILGRRDQWTLDERGCNTSPGGLSFTGDSGIGATPPSSLPSPSRAAIRSGGFG